MKVRIQDVSDRTLIETIKTSYSKADVCLKLNLNYNGTSTRRLSKIIKNYKLSFLKRPTKYKYIVKSCPVCNEPFRTIIGHRDEKTVCSHSCSNTYFRSGSNNGMFHKHSNGSKHYRTICFLNHPKKCLICDEHRIIEVHHLDHNHDNNSKDNLVPLCPTHHRLLHTKKYNKDITTRVKHVLNL